MGKTISANQIDTVTLVQHLKDAGKLEEAGGALAVVELFRFNADLANVALEKPTRNREFR